MGVHLAAAFALGRLARVNAFHRLPSNSATLEFPCYVCPGWAPNNQGLFIPLNLGSPPRPNPPSKGKKGV